MSTIAPPMTVEEFVKLPRGKEKYELVRGELRTMCLPSVTHGRILLNIGTSLNQFISSANLGRAYAGDVGFRIDRNPDTVRGCDVAFVSKDRVNESASYFDGAPDLAVEIISPSDIYTEVEEKVFQWLEAGARMVVTVNPRKRTVTVYRSRNQIKALTVNDTLSGDDVVPGWEMQVAEMFS